MVLAGTDKSGCRIGPAADGDAKLERRPSATSPDFTVEEKSELMTLSK